MKVETVLFNTVYLESILMNLLSNALKYRLPDRPFQVDISTGLNSKGGVLLSKKDNGLGIDLRRHHNKIFGLYQRFHVNTDGVGLGLFITKSQVTSMGGTIDVESEVGVDSTFSINFMKSTSSLMN
ncbi:MAG: ATP-binding protein [Bacteroidota bacterium]